MSARDGMARAEGFLLVLALGLLVTSFGAWETVLSAPEAAFGDDSPWRLQREETRSAWQSALELPAGRIPNGVAIGLGIVAALAAALGGSRLPRWGPAAAAFLAALLLVAFAVQTKDAAAASVGDAAVVSIAMCILIGTLALARGEAREGAA